MTRGSFIAGLIALGGLHFLKGNNSATYQQYYLLQCFISGFRFYQGPKLLSSMKVNDMLELVREPNNEFDQNAIALHWNKNKIGYIPAKSNEILSKLIDINIIELQAEITYLNADVKEWENVTIAISVLKKIDKKIPENVKYLTQLETPHYTTVRNNNETITKFYNKESVFAKQKNYKEFLLTNCTNKNVEKLVNQNLLRNGNYNDSIDYLVVDKEVLKKYEAKKSTKQSIVSELYNPKQMFDTKNLVILDINKAKEIVANLKELKNITDKLGRNFIEITI